MGQFLAKARIPIAICIALVLVMGAYFLAHGIGNPNSAQAESETALLSAIASRDSDNDGLPDWQEALYGTDPNNPDTLHLGMTDGEAVAKGLIVPKALSGSTVATTSPAGSSNGSLPPAPADDTMTAAFAKNFLAAYLSAKQAKGGANLTQDETAAVANEVIDSLSQSIKAAPDFKSARDLTVSGSGPDALKAFATSAEAVMLKNKNTAFTSELNLLKYEIAYNDPRALPQIVSIADSYRNSAIGIAVLPVPAELTATDLKLVNALMRVGEITSDFGRVNSDPLATMLALYQYPQAVADLGNAFIAIGGIYKAAGVSLTDGTPGASFVNIIADVAADQQSAKAAKP